MSIASDAYAEWANARKDMWVEKLWEAYNNKDWDLMFSIIEEIERYVWTE